MDEKIMDYIPALRVAKSMRVSLDNAARDLSMPRAQIIRLAILSGLPLVVKSIPRSTAPQSEAPI